MLLKCDKYHKYIDYNCNVVLIVDYVSKLSIKTIIIFDFNVDVYVFCNI